MAQTRYIENISIYEIRASRPTTIYYGATTCWWTHDPGHLGTYPDGLPCDPRGGTLFQTNDVQGFLRAAKDNPSYYGRHGFRAFMAAHHQNCVIRQGSYYYPWCFQTWEEYNEMLDRYDAAKHTP